MKYLIGRIVMVTSCFLVLFFIPMGLVKSAALIEQPGVVILLDTSNSMNAAAANYLVVEQIKQLVSALPSHYAAGLVTYNSDLQVANGLSADKSSLINALAQIDYHGYTNSGIGLEKAVKLLEPLQGAPKAIIFITDGEISMPDNESIQTATAKFSAALDLVNKHGIQLYAIALGGKNSLPTKSIYEDLSSDQKIYEVLSPDELAGAMKKILFTDLAVQKISVGIGDGEHGILKVKLPSLPLDKAKILITSSKPLANITADYNAVNAAIISGKNFAVIEVDQPNLPEVTVKFSADSGSIMQADLIPELYVKVKTEVVLLDNVGKNFTIKIIPVSPQNEQLLILNSDYFEGKTVQVLAGGKPYTATIHQGAASFDIENVEQTSLDCTVDFSSLNMNMIAPPQFSVELKPLNIVPLVAVGLLALAIMIIAIRIYTKKPLPLPVAPSVFDFSGKLNIYIVQAPDDSDIGPQVYNLYRLFSKKEITLAEILEKCDIKLLFAGADKITFKPGANKALLLTNQSDCTILKNRELIIKNRSCLIYFEEKITISFEDEISELVFHYKNVKPSERQ